MAEKAVKLSMPQLHRVELTLSYLLRGGVIASTVIVLVGLILMYVHHPEYLSGNLSAKDVMQKMAFPHTFHEVLTGLSHAEGRAVVILGLFVLIATPVLRVGVSVVIFFHQCDRLFTGITLLVLFLLLTSFLLGKAGG